MARYRPASQMSPTAIDLIDSAGVAECAELTATVARAAAELQPASSTKAAVAAAAGHVRIVASCILTHLAEP